MRVTKPLVLVLLLAYLAGCATPVPFDKLRYVGSWQGDESYLLITEDGFVRYEQYRALLVGELITGTEGPLRRFEGDNFIVGIAPLLTTFVVDKPPYLDGDEWKMVVRKKELVRIAP